MANMWNIRCDVVVDGVVGGDVSVVGRCKL